MLFPQDMVGFLQHENGRVREHAARYFKEVGDPSPATADDVWAAIDRFGWDHAQRLLDALPNLPAGDAAVSKLLDAFAARMKDEPIQRALRDAVQSLPFDALQRRRDDVLGNDAVPEESRQHLRQRLELADQPFDGLWDRLMEYAEKHKGKNVGEFDLDLAERLIEAIARHPQGCQRALALLNDESIEDWREIFAVQIVGAARYRPATEILVKKLTIDADYMNERAFDALSRIGGEEVVQRVEQAYLAASQFPRYMIHVPLGRIPLQSAEDALLRLFEREQARDLRGLLGDDLMQIASVRGFPLVRDMWLSGKVDPAYADLENALLVVSIMTGLEMPGAERLARELDERDRRAELRMRQMDEWMSQRQESGPVSDETLYSEDYDPIAPPVTIRREEPKVGRNDPCPCGSGKKYKKCCLAKA